MPEMRRVRLTDNKKKQGHSTSEFYFEGRRYFLQGTNTLPVDLAVANAWKAADSSVEIMPER